MNDRELLQMALDALITAELDGNCEYGATDALRARLAQPEPEPFEYWNAAEGWVKIEEVRQHFDTANCGTIYKHKGEGRIPLYTAPSKKEWVGLIEDEVDDIGCDFATLGGDIEGKNWFAFYLAIEAKLKEKNG